MLPVPVIASGGVGTLDHLVEGVRDGHATAVLAASIFHFGEFSIQEAKAHMVKAGIPMPYGYEQITGKSGQCRHMGICKGLALFKASPPLQERNIS